MNNMTLLRPFVFAAACAAFFTLSGCGSDNAELNRARNMKKTIYSLYRVDDSPLLAENYPRDTSARATYLAEGADQSVNEYTYLWPYSGTLSMMSALYDAAGDESDLEFIDHVVVEGLDRYYDTSREPYAYSSYITADRSDRFYDDNIWLAIDFTDLYIATGNPDYLAYARDIWRFVMSGRDDVLGDGIYWCEQKKGSKNACSNAPAAVCALKLYKATGEEEFLRTGRELYEWTYTTLRDAEDNLYFDNKSLDGRISRAKYSYNSGQMIEAGVLLYSITGEDRFLREAQATARGCYDKWFKEVRDGENTLHIMESGDVWFDAVMLRGLIALYRADGDGRYVSAVRATLDYAWRNGRDADGLFGKFLSRDDSADDKGGGNRRGRRKAKRRWLLTQAAYAEMSARMAKVDL